MSNKSIVIMYAIDPSTDTIKLLIGKHSIYNDLMFIGGGKKKNESESLCVSRELYEETRGIFGSVSNTHKIIENESFEYKPIFLTRHIERRNKKISIKLKVSTFFLRIDYDENIGLKFKDRDENDENWRGVCFNELSDIVWIDLSKLNIFFPMFFCEDKIIIKEINKHSTLQILINSNEKKQLSTLSNPKSAVLISTGQQGQPDKVRVAEGNSSPAPFGGSPRCRRQLTGQQGQPDNRDNRTKSALPSATQVRGAFGNSSPRWTPLTTNQRFSDENDSWTTVCYRNKIHSI
jgi:8-oxo-dGTP pyrophosphatase MutT (NUDIX family)